MKSTSIIYRVWKAILVLVGKIELHGCPVPFLKCARGFDISGAEQRAVMDLLRPGDVMLGRFTHHLTAVLIPGAWDHAAVYVGDGKVVHITGEGVSTQDVLEFMERDGVAVLRLPEMRPYQTADVTLRMTQIAYDYLTGDIDYDYLFDFTDKTRFSCSELVQSCLTTAFEISGLKSGIDFSLKETWTGKKIYTPDDLFNSGLTVIHESKSWRGENK